MKEEILCLKKNEKECALKKKFECRIGNVGGSDGSGMEGRFLVYYIVIE